jgi:hypothetical protein
MIKIETSLVSITETYKGTIELDRKYTFIVEKTIKDGPTSPEFQPYYVRDVSFPDDPGTGISSDVESLIEQTIINWGKKNGIGKSSKEE